MRGTVEERFWPKVDRRGQDDCWPYLGAHSAKGYGRFGLDGVHKSVGAHRIAYELAIGPIPAGMHIDHLCRTRDCCNPAHLEVVTAAENNRRAIPWNPNHVKTLCKWGHAYTPENTRWTLDKRSSRWHRQCRSCVARRNAERSERAQADAA